MHSFGYRYLVGINVSIKICFFRPLVGYGGGSSDDDDENDLSQNKSREGSLPHDRNFSEMTEERRAKLREIEVIVLIQYYYMYSRIVLWK